MILLEKLVLTAKKINPKAIRVESCPNIRRNKGELIFPLLKHIGMNMLSVYTVYVHPICWILNLMR